MNISSNVKTPTLKQLMKNPVHFLAFGFGSGLSPKAPGTMGTLVAIPIYCVMAQLSPTLYMVLLAGIVAAGFWLCGKTAQDIGVRDHGGIVWDEIAGLLLTLAWVSPSWQNIAIGFIFFRFFDIVKPWPISWLDRELKGGTGIMVDDLVAGLFAAACLYLTQLV
ncbi:MAG: phosphatidylglycerophosphatase [Cycloclasticus sp. symbiont of Poecilosclerida sp. M]|nr:MAG: phosphatidylglycerophosphatase [Cycloclasticus sp. symbiont of Poecilosclerida sp. M]